MRPDRPNWTEIEESMRAEREAMLAHDGINVRLAVEMTRKSIVDLKAAHERRERAEAKKEFMAHCAKAAERSRERERRMNAET